MAIISTTVLTALTLPNIAKLLFRLAIGLMVLTVVLLILPAWPLPVGIGTAIEWAVDTVWGFDFLLPVELMITLLFYSLAIDVFFYSIRLFMWIKEMLMSNKYS